MAKSLRAKCLEAAQLLARLAAADDNGYCTCVSCGKVAQWNKEMHGGHFIAKGKSSYWALELENIHPQCSYCNGFDMNGGAASHRYRDWMEDMYGKDFVEGMFRDMRKPRKLYTADYREMLSDFNALIKEHKERIGIS